MRLATITQVPVRITSELYEWMIKMGKPEPLSGEYQKCFTAYQKALYLVDANQDPQLWYGIGLLYNKFESYEYAESALQTVLRISPDFEHRHEILYKLGNIYQKTGSYDNAINYFTQSAEQEDLPLTRRVDLKCHTAVCHQKKGELNQAIHLLNEALQMDDQHFKTYQYLAWVYALKGEFNTALNLLNTAKELCKDNCAELGDTHYLIGRIYLMNGSLQEGQSSFQRAIYKNPNAYVYWCSIGVLYAKAKQASDAFECFIRASTLCYDRPEVWYNMGVLYEQCCQVSEAKLAYQKLLQVDPDYRNIAQRVEKINSGEEYGEQLDFIHPNFEISEVPFSIIRSDKQMKPLRPLNGLVGDDESPEANGEMEINRPMNLRQPPRELPRQVPDAQPTEQRQEQLMTADIFLPSSGSSTPLSSRDTAVHSVVVNQYDQELRRFPEPAGQRISRPEPTYQREAPVQPMPQPVRQPETKKEPEPTPLPPTNTVQPAQAWEESSYQYKDEKPAAPQPSYPQYPGQQPAGEGQGGQYQMYYQYPPHMYPQYMGSQQNPNNSMHAQPSQQPPQPPQPPQSVHQPQSSAQSNQNSGPQQQAYPSPFQQAPQGQHSPQPNSPQSMGYPPNMQPPMGMPPNMPPHGMFPPMPPGMGFGFPMPMPHMMGGMQQNPQQGQPMPPGFPQNPQQSVDGAKPVMPQMMGYPPMMMNPMMSMFYQMNPIAMMSQMRAMQQQQQQMRQKTQAEEKNEESGTESEEESYQPTKRLRSKKGGKDQGRKRRR